jgi:hypothetical protein
MNGFKFCRTGMSHALRRGEGGWSVPRCCTGYHGGAYCLRGWLMTVVTHDLAANLGSVSPDSSAGRYSVWG